MNLQVGLWGKVTQVSLCIDGFGADWALGFELPLHSDSSTEVLEATPTAGNIHFYLRNCITVALY